MGWVPSGFPCFLQQFWWPTCGFPYFFQYLRTVGASLWVPLLFAALLVAYMWVPLFFPISQDGGGFPLGSLFFAAVLVAYMWVPLFFPISQDGGFPAGSLVFVTLEVGSHGFTACVAEMCERSVALAFTACQLGSRWVPLFFATWIALFFAVSQLRLHMLFAPLGNICCKNHGIHFQCCQNVRNPERVPLVFAAC